MRRKKRKICVFSGKRGGFGAYVPLMRLIEKDPELELHILLGDMHASAEFGKTAGEARALFPKSPIHLIRMGTGRGDTSEIRAENLGTCIREAARILARIRPDILMVHGDRGEHLGAALAGLVMNMAVTHSQGGDVSGNIDEIIRHSITKLAHLHFSETKETTKRITRLGEEPWRIHTVGSLYIDRIVKKMYTPVALAKRKYGIEHWEKYAIVIFHPETFASREENYTTARNIFSALKKSGIPGVVVYPSSDPGYREIIGAIEKIKKDMHFTIHKNIENLDFLGLMSGAGFMIGNSSAAIKEAPYFQLAAINIGERESGREREENVMDCGRGERAILNAIRFVSEDAYYRKKLRQCGCHLGDGHASEKIFKIVKTIKINDALLKKRITY